MTAIEQQIIALEARLAKGSDWLDAASAGLATLAPGTAAYIERHGQYDNQQARWTTLLEELTALVKQCHHSQHELVCLHGADGTRYPYARCRVCRNNLAGVGMYLAADEPLLRGVDVATLPVSTDYLTPDERVRLEAANAAGRAWERVAG